MQVTIDSTEPLDRVLPVINALYGVSLSVPEPVATGKATAAAAPRRSRSTKTASGSAPTRRHKRATVTAGAVREWARSNGYEVSSRGRVSGQLLDAYRAAN